ncbi:hypothetical protein [Leucobacter sp. W1153]|uniref:hypothetical protein n=1 Tax=unclassified Leucobacter TaxID=2621730 RepID=UPI003F30F1D0
MSGQQLVDRAMRDCRAAVGRLQDDGVEPEALAEFVPAGRRWLVLPRAATMRPLGEVWRLGALLLGTDGTLYAAGRATRAAERGRPGYQSASREERRELAAAALHGGYPAGSPVNFDAAPIRLVELVTRHDLSGDAADPPVLLDSPDGPGTPAPAETTLSGDPALPVGVWGGELRVRWRPGATLDGAATLDTYLAERVELLVNPPFAAT